MRSVALAFAFVLPLATLAQAQQDDIDKVHGRVARKAAPATVAVDGGGLRGSGVIIDKSGIILTSPTAVGMSTSRVTVLTKGAKTYTGKVMGRANDRELVVIKIDAAQDLPFLE